MTAGSLVANAAGYALHLPASRWLGPDGYGGFAALVSLQLLVAVPALALQAVVARERVRGGATIALRLLGVRVAIVVAVAATALSYPIASLLDTPIAAVAAALATGPMLCAVAVEQGLVQGDRRFGILGALLALVGLSKVVPAVMVLAGGGGVTAALASAVAGLFGVWLAARLVGARLRSGASQTEPGPDNRLSHPRVPGVWSVLSAGQVQMAIIALSSVDLVLARALLSPDDAGQYALGAVATKVAFWLPHAVGTVLYPQMATPTHRRAAIRTAVAVLVAVGAFVVVAATVAAPFVPLAVGRAYAPVVPLLWAFATLGVLLSVLHALVLAQIAAERTAESLLVWAGLAATALILWLVPRNIPAFLTSTVVTVAVVTVVAVVRSLTLTPASFSRRGTHT